MRHRLLTAAALPALLALAASSAAAQQKEDEPPVKQVDSVKASRAIEKGVEYLKKRLNENASLSSPVGTVRVHMNELVLYTLAHANVPENDPVVVKLFDEMAKQPMERTYEVALQAMILEDLNRVKYQARIVQCAQFLVDNQCACGQWSYGEPAGSAGPLVSLEGPPVRSSDKPRKKFSVTSKRNGPATGDNSNSQYAALGLRACSDAGVGIPPGVISKAAKWWRGAQHDGDKKDVYGGRGWCYGPKTGCPWNTVCRPYGSMTAGAVASLTIYDYMTGVPWKRDRDIQAGLQWLDRNWSVTEHPGPPEIKDATKDWMLYYHLYAVERVGTLFGAERIGKHEWYPEGAEHLFAAQAADGSWLSPQSGAEGDNYIWDTCFAILFLRRATKPLIDIATEGSRKK